MKKLTLNKKVAIIILLALLIAGAILFFKYQKSLQNENVNMGPYYINEDQDFCSRIRFDCIEHYEPFFDETGCGCTPISN